MIQVQSIEDPFRNPALAGPIFRLLKRADAMGLVSQTISKLDLPAFREVIASLRKAGIARQVDETGGLPSFKAGKASSHGELLRVMNLLTEALEGSPAPAYEWRRVNELFQSEPDRLAELLGISVSSLRRYSSQARETPDDIASRLHFLALLTGDLAGAYNEIGIRNWFQRKRTLLDGKAPRDLLRGAWQPGDRGPERVRTLARGLAAGSAT
jgi:hypothetical protein